MKVRQLCLLISLVVVLMSPLTIASDVDADTDIKNTGVYIYARDNIVLPEDSENASASMERLHSEGCNTIQLFIVSLDDIFIDIPSDLMISARACDATMTVKLVNGTLSFDNLALDDIQLADGLTYRFGFEVIAAPPIHSEFVGNDIVMHMSLTVSGEPYRNDLGGSIRMMVPYIIPEDRIEHEIMIFWLPDNSIPEQINGTEYVIIDNTEYLAFDLDRFAIYSLGTGEYLPTYDDGKETDLLYTAILVISVLCTTVISTIAMFRYFNKF